MPSILLTKLYILAADHETKDGMYTSGWFAASPARGSLKFNLSIQPEFFRIHFTWEFTIAFVIGVFHTQSVVLGECFLGKEIQFRTGVKRVFIRFKIMINSDQFGAHHITGNGKKQINQTLGRRCQELIRPALKCMIGAK